MSILIVDDNPVSVVALESSLQSAGHSTFTARTGGEALELLRGQDVALIITDIKMPDMDGYELLTALSENDSWHEIPVVVVSSMGDRDSVLRAAKMGCRDFIVKPIDGKKLLQSVDNLLESTTAPRLPVIRDSAESIEKLGMTPQAFHKILHSFWRQVNVITVRLENLPHNQMDAGFVRDLLELSEGALLTGAEKLRLRLSGLQTLDPKGLEAAAGADVLADLRALRRALIIALRNWHS